MKNGGFRIFKKNFGLKSEDRRRLRKLAGTRQYVIKISFKLRRSDYASSRKDNWSCFPQAP